MISYRITYWKNDVAVLSVRRFRKPSAVLSYINNKITTVATLLIFEGCYCVKAINGEYSIKQHLNNVIDFRSKNGEVKK